MLWALAFIGVLGAAWLTHAGTCLARGQWLFMITGAILFPVGVIHGVGIWFGWWH